MSSKNYFIEGPIQPSFIADQISGHSRKHNIGGHSIFLGQVRADVKEDKVVQAIEYSAYYDMASQKIYEIREEAFSKRALTCIHIFHSIGKVMAGEISLFIFVSSVHRKESVEAMTEIIEQVKYDVPIWKKEIMMDKTSRWVE